jgi:hypothetical protein
MFHSVPRVPFANLEHFACVITQTSASLHLNGGVLYNNHLQSYGEYNTELI